jgi:hypothetical protein
MLVQELLSLIGIEVIPHNDGPTYGYFWRSAVYRDWSGPHDTAEEAQRAALRDLLRFARIGYAYELGGDEEASALIPRFS